MSKKQFEWLCRSCHFEYAAVRSGGLKAFVGRVALLTTKLRDQIKTVNVELTSKATTSSAGRYIIHIYKEI